MLKNYFLVIPKTQFCNTLVPPKIVIDIHFHPRTTRRRKSKNKTKLAHYSACWRTYRVVQRSSGSSFLKHNHFTSLCLSPRWKNKWRVIATGLVEIPSSRLLLQGLSGDWCCVHAPLTMARIVDGTKTTLQIFLWSLLHEKNTNYAINLNRICECHILVRVRYYSANISPIFGRWWQFMASPSRSPSFAFCESAFHCVPF